MLIVQEGYIAVSCESQFNNYVDRISFQVAKSSFNCRSLAMFRKNIKRFHAMPLLLTKLLIIFCDLSMHYVFPPSYVVSLILKNPQLNILIFKKSIVNSFKNYMR